MKNVQRPEIVTDDHLQMLDDLYSNDGTITLTDFAEIYNVTVPEASTIIAYWDASYKERKFGS